jgi:hypothetical protein
MPIQGTVPVGGSFAPTDPADSFGTHNDKWGVGGYRIVKTLADRNAIPVNESNLLNLDDTLASGRRKLGMMVYVSDDAKLYVLTIVQATWNGYTESQKVAALANNANFVEFVGGESSPLTTKGDLYTFSTVNTRLPVGTNSQILAADSTQVTGLKWIDVPATVTPAALTKTDDTNVTLTLGGTPATALLQAVSLTLGWSGTLADSRIASASNWNTAYTDRLKWDGGSTGLDAATGRTSLGLGTFAVVNYPTWVSGTPFIKMTAAGTFALDTNTYLTSAVTSIGMTVPPAFNVTPTSITSTGTFDITSVGLVSQYIRGDGTLANFPTSAGGGSSVSYYLNGSIDQGTFGGSTYYQMSKTPILGGGTTFTRTHGQGNGLIAQFITDAGDPNLLSIPAGNWNLELFFKASSGGGSPSYYVELYKYDTIGLTFTLIASDVLTPEGITNGTTLDAYFTALAVPTTTLALTDRLALRVFVNTSNKTIELHTENGHLCQVITTFSTGITALNGLTAQVQNFANDTNFQISSSSSTHTLTWAGSLSAVRGGTGLTTIAARSILVANTLNTYTTLTPTALQSVRINAGGTAWETFTPAGGGDMLLGTDQTVTEFKTFRFGKFLLRNTGNNFSATINVGAITGARTYTIPETNTSTASFVMTEGAQTIAGATIFSSLITSSVAASGVALQLTNVGTSIQWSTGPAVSNIFNINLGLGYYGIGFGLYNGTSCTERVRIVPIFDLSDTRIGIDAGATPAGKLHIKDTNGYVPILFLDGVNKPNGIPLNSELRFITINTNYNKRWTSGSTVAAQREIYITAPNYGGLSSGTVFTNTATVAISGPPAALSLANFTNTPSALWIESGQSRFDGNVLIGGTSVSVSALVEIVSTTKGVRFPNMTTTQKNAIVSPVAGLVIYDTTLNKLCVYTTAWEIITSL